MKVRREGGGMMAVCRRKLGTYGLGVEDWVATTKWNHGKAWSNQSEEGEREENLYGVDSSSPLFLWGDVRADEYG